MTLCVIMGLGLTLDTAMLVSGIGVDLGAGINLDVGMSLDITLGKMGLGFGLDHRHGMDVGSCTGSCVMSGLWHGHGT